MLVLIILRRLQALFGLSNSFCGLLENRSVEVATFLFALNKGGPGTVRTDIKEVAEQLISR